MTSSAVLHGQTILLTRQPEQSLALQELLEGNGASCWYIPTIRIAAILRAINERARQLIANADGLIFVSANAVDEFLKQARDAQLAFPRVKLFAVGKGTQRALSRQGLSAQIPTNEDYSSEGLLALPELQCAQKSWVIVRGKGGRERLAQGLKSANSQVEYIEVYERCLPKVDRSKIEQKWQQTAPTAMVITSADSYKNLRQLLPASLCTKVLALPVVVIHPRIAKAVSEQGHQGPIITATNSENESLLDALTHLLKG